MTFIIKVQCTNNGCSMKSHRVETKLKVCLGCGHKLTSDLDVPFAEGPGRDLINKLRKIQGW